LAYTYDLADRMLTASNSAGSYTFTYDALDQVRTQDFTGVEPSSSSISIIKMAKATSAFALSLAL
jgi:YD repeat-containing protein